MAPVVPTQRSLFSRDTVRSAPAGTRRPSETPHGASRQHPSLLWDRDAVVSPNVHLPSTDESGHGNAALPLWRERRPRVPIAAETSRLVNRAVTTPKPGHFPELPGERFDIIYADPPWDYKGQLQHAGPGSQDTGGAVRHYSTVTSSDLKRLDIQRIAAKDCLLFMWSTNPHLDQAIDLGKSWGFAWATVAFVWDKIRVNPGFYTLSQCELCLVFKRGKIPRPRGARNVRQLVQFKRGPHSTKPAEVRKRIDDMFPDQKRIELFARSLTKGWYSWGLEASNGA